MATLSDLYFGPLANQRGLTAPTLSSQGLNLWNENPNPERIWGNTTTLGGNSLYVRDNNLDYGQISDPTLQGMLAEQMYGRANAGVGAFLGDTYKLNNWNGQYGGDGQSGSIDTSMNIAPLQQLAQQTGFDTSGYNLGQQTANNQDYDMSRGGQALYADLNNYLKDYTSISGLSSWTGNPNPMAATKTMYKRDENGQLVPVSAPQEYIQRKGGAWNNMKDTGFISALSMLMPAFGGFGGIAGAGTTGTLTAGGGLGVTNGLAGVIGTGATNALVNAGASAALSGSGAKGFGMNVLGSLAGAGVNSAMGGKGLSNMFDTSTAGQALPQNPMGNFNNAIGASGLGGSIFGQGMQALGAGKNLAQLFSGGQYGV